MMGKKIKLGHALSSHLRAAKQLHKISPKFFLVTTLYSFTAALTPYVTVFFSAQILKELALLRRADVLWQWVIAGVMCTGLFAVLKAIFYQRYETLFDDLYGRKEILFAQKMFSMDYADMDKQENHDLRAQISQNENWSAWGLMRVPEVYEYGLKSIFGLLAGSALTVSLFTSPVPETAGWLTILNNPVFVLVLAAIMVLVSMLAGACNVKAISYWSSAAEAATFGNRLFGFFGFIGTHKGRGTDIRMYNQQNLVSTYWSKNSDFGADGPIGKISRGPLGIYSALGTGITVLITGSVYVFTCLKAWAGAFDIGSITQYVGAATAMADSIFELTGLLGILKTNTEYLDTTFEFLDIPNAMYQGSLTTEKRSDRQYEVEFKNVSFKYPGSQNWALKNVSMKFKVGKRLAIVGENGSGKTTFIKLLCRLYDPQEGQILLNGIDIRKYNYRDYMDVFSIVFQDFQLISQPLGANVAGSSTYDEAKVRKALMDAGFGERLATMPDGLNTQLYKDFTENGVEVSGGEAQKIAIARALYKDAPFIILDEPTAALDPIAEAEIYSKFNDISGDKTAIYISHRLSSCKFCDEIAVFHQGGLIQQGTHESLLADTAGKYHQLWHAQAQYYAECDG
ncbi:MAG: ABC transporter ATP-binding protein [Oscillospiraceae bacterium]|nr:ABC transporter ATP-binding protein [Oscillospiraceae bacterium]